MARGKTLQELTSDLRDELRRANTPAASPDDTASLRRTINHVYRTLYYAHDWPHLTKMFDRMTINAGQRLYDLPDGLDYDRIIEAKVWWASDPYDIERGIGFADYAAYDPEDDERTSPIEKWDIRFTGDKEQLEFWPLPDETTQTVQFHGVHAWAELVDNTDICRLDSDLIVLYAAAELLPKDSADKETKAAAAKDLLALLKKRATAGGGRTFTNGAGSPGERLHPRSTVRVGG